MPAPRRVLMTADAVGGVWRYALDLAAALRARGTSTVLAVLGPGPSEAMRREAEECCEAVATFPCRLEWMDDPWEDVDAAGVWLQELAAGWPSDVIHLNGFAHASLDWDRPVVVVAHSDVSSWWRAVHQCAPPPDRDEYRARVRRALADADAVVAPSHAMAAALAQEYGPVTARVIPNGCALAASQPRRRAKTPMIFAAGRLWDQAKNIAALCAIAPGRAWPVYVAGDASLAEGGRTPLQNVTHLGVLAAADVQQWMASAAIYALPARYEPFGLSILEAATAGCALVLGDIPSLREHWEGAALFVPPEDSEALATVLDRLIADASLRDRLAAAAVERSQHFTTAAMARRYEDLYRDVLTAAESSSILASVAEGRR